MLRYFFSDVFQIRLKKKFEGEANELELALEGANRVRCRTNNNNKQTINK